MSQAWRWAGRAALLLLALLMLFPVYWMWATAVRPGTDLFSRGLDLWPGERDWGHFARAWARYPFGRWYVNSLVIAAAGAALSVALDLMAGYAFAKFRFPARDWLFVLLLSTIMVPTQVLLPTQFLMVAAMGGLDTYWAVILPRAAEAFGVFLARQFLRGVPDELLEAARLDGASEWAIFWRIVVPISRPLVAVLALFALVGRWNEFAWPLVVLKDTDALTVPVGLSLLKGEHSTEWSQIMAMALVSVLPVLAVFGVLQRWFVEGMGRGR